MTFLRLTRRLRSFRAAASLVIMMCAPFSANASESVNSDLIGTWKLTKVLDSSEISSMDDAEAEGLLEKTLVIAPEKITVAGESCRKPPKFTRHYEDGALYIRETAHAPVGRLGIPTTVEVVELSCTEVLMKGYNRIVVYWKGFFFDAVRQEEPVQ